MNVRTNLWQPVMCIFAVGGISAATASADTYTWNTASGGNWSDLSASGWNAAAYPHAAGDVATVSQNITSDQTLTIDVADAIVGSLTLADATTANFNWIIATSNAATNKLTFDNGGSNATLSVTSSSVTGSHVIAAPVVLNSNLQVSVTGTGTNKQLTLSGPISGSGGLIIPSTSTGILTLSSANSFSGATTISAGSGSAGTLRLTDTGALTNSALTLNAGAGTATGGSVLQLRSDTDNALFATAAITLAGNSTINVDQLTAGSTGKTLGLGNIAVNDLNTNLYVTGGNGYALQMGDITLNSVTGKKLSVFANTAGVTIGNVTSLAPAGKIDTFQLDGTGTGGVTGEVTGVISDGSAGGKVAFIKTNTSTWTLSAANTFTGGASIANGTLILNNALALQNTGLTISANNGLAFASGINTFTTGYLAGAGNFSLTDATNNPVTLRIGNDNANSFTAYSGVISGSGGLTKIGTAQVLIGGANSNTYTGATTIEAGTIKLATSDALPVTTSLVVNGGQLDMNSKSQTVEQLTGSASGTVTNSYGNSTSTLTVTGTSQYDGLLANGNNATKILALVKSVGGTLTLTNANTYSGGTVITAGTLLANNTTGSATGTGSISVDGTLGGSGRIAMATGSAVTINAGGVLAPGNSPGILTLVGTQTETPAAGSATLNFTDGSTFAVQLFGSTVGSEYDQVDLTGNVDLGNASLLVDLGMALSADQVFTIINNDAADAVLNTFAGLSQDAILPGVSSNGYGLKISYIGEAGSITGGNDVVLYTFATAIPEPASLAMLAMGGLLLAARRRK